MTTLKKISILSGTAVIVIVVLLSEDYIVIQILAMMIGVANAGIISKNTKYSDIIDGYSNRDRKGEKVFCCDKGCNDTTAKRSAESVSNGIHKLYKR